MIHVQVVGDETFYTSISKMSYSIQIEVNEEIVRMGTEIRNNILTSMRNTKKRTTNPVKARRVAPHFPSLPGYPPAVDRGRLVNDIKMSVTRTGLSNVEVEVGDVSQKYGKTLEESENPKILRPWLKPAYADIDFEERISRIISFKVNTL